MAVEFTPQEKAEVILALSMRINMIQTGDPMISQQDAVNMDMRDKINPLSLEQMQFILDLHQLKRKIQQG